MDKYFEDVEISITRNLKHYPSTCQITSEERKELKAKENVSIKEEDYSTEKLRKKIRKDISLVEISPYAVGPYRERRPAWTAMFGFGYSQYNPEDYDPDFTIESSDTYFGSAEAPLIEMNLSLKRNFSLAAFSLELGVGQYSNNSRDIVTATGTQAGTLKVTPIRLGIGLALDTLFKEPYLVPYFVVGGYTMLYREVLGTQAVNGNTAFGLYYAGGMRFQLDWLDEHGDNSGYEEAGLENTFLYVEYRSFLSAAAAKPNLGSPKSQPFQLGAGMALEF